MQPRSAHDAVATRPSTTAGATFVSRMAARDGPIPDPAAAALLLDGVAHSLARWFGPFGCHALLTRALAHARLAHPGLTALRVRSALTPVLDGVAETAQTYGSTATTDGVTAVITGVVDLVGSVIGDDMALQLLERHTDGPPVDGPPGVAS